MGISHCLTDSGETALKLTFSLIEDFLNSSFRFDIYQKLEVLLTR